jgi:hypothetical protein
MRDKGANKKSAWSEKSNGERKSQLLEDYEMPTEEGEGPQPIKSIFNPN